MVNHEAKGEKRKHGMVSFRIIVWQNNFVKAFNNLITQTY